MRTLNLGILAHVDAGKTTLTERLLHAAGVIDEIGSVDDGSTQTDSLALERRRGITIKSAVVSFVVGDVTVNLIDTPGHPDFIAEVERVLGVLDGAVLVVSATDGVQPQTRVLMRTLRRLGIPTLIFVNKTDRMRARPEAVLRSIAEKLTPAIAAGDAVADLLAENDDAFLAAYLDGQVTPDRLRAELAAQTGRALVHPVFFGSAITGAGVDALVTGITTLLPAAGDDAGGPVSGTVFKVDRGPSGEKLAYVRMFSGTLRVRDRVGDRAKVTAVEVFERGAAVPRASVAAGRIGRLHGLPDVRVGDAIGEPRAAGERHFPPPTLETAVLPARDRDRGALHDALTRLAEQDPLINLRRGGAELYVSLYGEVQKEVIEATLADDFGLAVAFRETTTIHIERPIGTGAAVEVIKQGSNPFLATIGLKVEPGDGFRLGIELGALPLAFITAIEETVAETFRQGIYGWQVTGCAVTLTHSGYWPRQSHSHGVFDKSMSSTAGDFRNLTPLVLMDALRRAGTRVHEPMHRFHLEIPADAYGALLPVLTKLRGVPEAPGFRGPACLLEGVLPAAAAAELERRLPPLTGGEGVLESAFDHYRPVTGPPPRRARSDHDPLDRKEYLLRVARRVG